VIGSKSWAVVLCKFSDQPGTPHDPQWYQDFVTHSAPNKDGLWNFWYDVSYGQMDLNGSQVFGQIGGNGQIVPQWNTLKHPLSYYADPKNFPKGNTRLGLWKDCAETVQGMDFRPYYGVLAMLNAKRETGAVPGQEPRPDTLNGKQGTWGAVVLDSLAQDVKNGAHEMGHGFGLNHNYDTALNQCGGRPGEYCDPFDAMGRDYGWNMFQTSFGRSSPGLSTPNLAKLGWSPYPTIADPSQPEDVGLSPIETTHSMVQVPIDDPQQPHYYTVEYRDPSLAYASGTKWGRTLPGPELLIHEVRPDGRFYLVDTGGGPNFGLCENFVGVNNIDIMLVDTPTPSDPYDPGPQAFVRIGRLYDGWLDPKPNYCNGGRGLQGSGGGGGPSPPTPPCPPGWQRAFDGVKWICFAAERFQ
jgi:hypothetical protein